MHMLYIAICTYVHFNVGTTNSLKSFPQLRALDDCGEIPETTTKCNKNTGEKTKLQKWTRGIWICASGGGHIQMWQPLYQ